MFHRDFSDVEPELPRAGHHFRVHEKSMRLRHQRSKHLAPKYLECAVHIAKVRPQKCSRQPVITPGEKPPPPRVLPVEPVAHDNRVIDRMASQFSKVRQIELTVGIGEGDEVIPRGLEAAAKGRTISAIGAMAEKSGVGGVWERPLHDSDRFIRTAVIDHQHFE